MELFKKSNVVDYMSKNGAYKLLYTKHFYNYGVTIKQLAFFLNVEIYLLNHLFINSSCILKDALATQLYLSGFWTLIVGQCGFRGHNVS